MTWDELKQTCAACNNCSLCASRHHVVFGVGQENADILFVGEGPGEQEDLQGEPFVGAAGKLLDDMLSIVDVSRDKNCYIANVVKCRPPHNRDPEEEEQNACGGYLMNQIDLILRSPGSMEPGMSRTASGTVLSIILRHCFVTLPKDRKPSTICCLYGT